MIEIIPSILTEPVEQYQDVLNRIEKVFNIVQFDVMDGIFVPKVTFDWTVVRYLRTSMLQEAHLMIENPQGEIMKYVDAGCLSILYHVEAWNDVKTHRRLYQKLAQQEVGLGIAISPDTPIQDIFPYLEYVNKVLVMTVRPGLAGQNFIPATLQKIRDVRDKSDVDIEVDGGINESTIKDVANAGANHIIVGSGLFKHGTPKENKEKLLRLIER